MRDARCHGGGTAFAAWAPAGFLLFAGAARGGVPDPVGCTEGAEFVANGTARDAFLDRMHADFVALRALLRALRGFVHDAADEDFLLGQASAVVDRPNAPAAHCVEFFRAGLGRRMV
jgi:hypothetical protein